MPAEMITAGIHKLLWTQHGGSGTNLLLNDVLDMGLNEFVEWCTWVDEQREREADAIRNG